MLSIDEAGMRMDFLLMGLVIATLLVSLVAGFLWAFSSVVMPGIARLSDREFVRAFQELDGIIQRGNPLFFLIWAGSAVVLLVVAVAGVVLLQGVPRTLLLCAAGVYLLAVQLPTATINIPLNNALHSCDANDQAANAVGDARAAFEARWNHWNRRRTLAAGLAAILLLLTLYSVS